MKLGTILLNVGDVDALKQAREWYQNLLGLNVRTDEPGESVFFAENGGTTLGLHTGRPLPSPDLLTIYFEVDDIDATYEQLSGRGVEFTREPGDRPWGGRVAETSDPIGHAVHVMSWPA